MKIIKINLYMIFFIIKPKYNQKPDESNHPMPIIYHLAQSNYLSLSHLFLRQKNYIEIIEKWNKKKKNEIELG